MLRSRPTTSSIPEGGGEGSSTKIKRRKVRKKRREQQRQSQRGSLSPFSCILVCVMAITVCVISYQTLSSSSSPSPIESQIKRLRKNSVGKEHGVVRNENEMEIPPLSLYNLEFPSIDGELISFSRFVGHPAIVINVASQ